MSLADLLRQEILAGRLPPGTLLSQTETAERYGVSRIPVRDAFQQLAHDRLVTVIPGKGAQVIRLSAAELTEVYDLRILLEGDLLRRAVRAAGPDYAAEVDYALRKSDLEAGRPGWADGDWFFHRTLYAPASRPRQLAMAEELRRLCLVHVPSYDTLTQATPDWLAHHAAMARAAVAGRAEDAVAALEQHLDAARRFLLGLSPEDPGSGNQVAEDLGHV